MATRIRIVTGLILFAFVTMHLINVALGLHSIELMDRARPIFMAPWTNPLGTLVLLLALLAHFVLGLIAIYRRDTLRLSRADMVQLLSSLFIIPLMTPHVVGTAVAARLGIEPTFGKLIPYFWIDVPIEGLRQVLLLAFLWVHGCVGFYTWARIQPWWRRTGAFLNPLAVAIPVLGLLGFVGAGNEAIELRQNPPIAIEAPAETGAEETTVAGEVEEPAAEDEEVAEPITPERFNEILALLKQINWTVFYVYLAAIAATFGARLLRQFEARNDLRVAFIDGPVIRAQTGMTLLDMARINEAPLAHLCGGRGRCGTCRVRVIEASGDLPPLNDAERATLGRLKAPPDVRLACQLHPNPGSITVERVLPPFVRPRDIHKKPEPAAAVETPVEAPAGAA